MCSAKWYSLINWTSAVFCLIALRWILSVYLLTILGPVLRLSIHPFSWQHWPNGQRFNWLLVEENPHYLIRIIKTEPESENHVEPSRFEVEQGGRQAGRKAGRQAGRQDGYLFGSLNRHVMLTFESSLTSSNQTVTLLLDVYRTTAVVVVDMDTWSVKSTNIEPMLLNVRRWANVRAVMAIRNVPAGLFHEIYTCEKCKQ